MPEKIPVGATIANAYRFAFGNIVNNLGVILIPVIILWALSFAISRPYQAALTKLASGDPQPFRNSALILIAYFVVIFVLLVAQWASLTKEALGIRKGSVFRQNPFGLATWRLLAMYLLFLLAMAAVYIAILIVSLLGGIVFGVLASTLRGQGLVAILAIAVILGIIAAVCLLFLAAIRLSFFMAPIAVAEEKIDLFRGWQLTRGNFWRIFAILMAVMIPLILADLIYVLYAFKGNLLPPNNSPEALAQWQQYQREQMVRSFGLYRTYWYILYPAGLLIGAVIYALLAGASAFAYRSLVSDEAVSPSAS
ncbi:MAG: hypothetical protein JO056_03730 [Alphaproteobacteria bacterium]|nr:hypothetical protein [Alphaproteobacteria bacterium]